MQTVEFTWTVSPSVGVQAQEVAVTSVDGEIVYGHQKILADVTSFVVDCAEGAQIVGHVQSLRGDEKALYTSPAYTVPTRPLAPASNGEFRVIEPVRTVF